MDPDPVRPWGRGAAPAPCVTGTHVPGGAGAPPGGSVFGRRSRSARSRSCAGPRERQTACQELAEREAVTPPREARPGPEDAACGTPEGEPTKTSSPVKFRRCTPEGVPYPSVGGAVLNDDPLRQAEFKLEDKF